MNNTLKHTLRISAWTAAAAGLVGAAIIGIVSREAGDAAAGGMAVALVASAAVFVVTVFVVASRRQNAKRLVRSLLWGAAVGALVGAASWYAGWRPAADLATHAAAGAVIWGITAAYIEAAKCLHD